VPFDLYRNIGSNLPALLADAGPAVTIPAGVTPADVMSAFRTPWVGFPNKATRAAFDTQLDDAKGAAGHYASAQTAQRGGYVLTSFFIAGFGTHWINWKYVNRPFDPAHPAMLLYDGDGTNARLVALSYYVRSDRGPPSGFAGANDLWHRHFGTCYAGGFLIGEQILTSDTCAKRCMARATGAVTAPVGTQTEIVPMQRFLASHPEPEDLPPYCHLVPGNNLWMLHVWVVPGHSNPAGMFTTRNQKLRSCVGVCRPADE
jgi:hypothetical protein